MTKGNCLDCPLLGVAKRKTGKGENGWETSELSLDNFLTQNAKDTRLTVIRAQADEIRECPRCRQLFTEAFKVPEMWWSRWCRRSNGYFGCEDTTDEQGDFDGHNTWFRFIVKQTLDNVPKGQKDYIWYKFNIFTRWLLNTNQTIVVVFDPPPGVRERIPSPLLDASETSNFSDPYLIHSLFAEDVVRLQDDAVWGIRNLVREIEVHRTASAAPNPDYPRLHDIARHAIHVSETLDLAVKTVDCMMSRHDQFLSDRSASDDKIKTTQRQIRNRMYFYDHMLRSLRFRSASNKERLLNEIQLTFNTVAQYDSRISVQIGRAAQSDSSAMKTIAFLTLTFFPATFISAIFSMSFFNFNPDEDRWTVSKKFWVYWAVAIPLTCITAISWTFWQKISPLKPIGEEEVLKSRGVQLVGDLNEMATKLRDDSGDRYITEKV
ncbi:hypothetical protein K432DRAFT_425842 [Lepidopterella palustris CBS 459.81]|uniref:Mg2+ transporter protein n=1 Tax=Lepidopterella palustris CBS 459.81 TaxID=1314670 RepID=A0A8E2JF39_9PEZI|nr:hypothetical protein K432DRAFT_425842 [Lepidopterella palustris CBS 459.81]